MKSLQKHLILKIVVRLYKTPMPETVEILDSDTLRILCARIYIIQVPDKVSTGFIPAHTPYFFFFFFLISL